MVRRRWIVAFLGSGAVALAACGTAAPATGAVLGVATGPASAATATPAASPAVPAPAAAAAAPAPPAGAPTRSAAPAATTRPTAQPTPQPYPVVRLASPPSQPVALHVGQLLVINLSGTTDYPWTMASYGPATVLTLVSLKAWQGTVTITVRGFAQGTATITVDHVQVCPPPASAAPGSPVSAVCAANEYPITVTVG